MVETGQLRAMKKINKLKGYQDQNHRLFNQYNKAIYSQDSDKGNGDMWDAI